MKKFILLTALAFAALPATFLAQKLTFEVYAGPQYDLIPKAQTTMTYDNVTLEQENPGSNLYKRALVTYEQTNTYTFKTQPLFNAGFRTRGKIGAGWSWAVGARVQGRRFEREDQNSLDIVATQPLPGTVLLNTGNDFRTCDTAIIRRDGGIIISGGLFNQVNMPKYTQYQLGIPVEFAYSFPSGKLDLFGEVAINAQLLARVRRLTFESSQEIINGKVTCISDFSIQTLKAESDFKALAVTAGAGARWHVMSPVFIELGVNRAMTGILTPFQNFFSNTSTVTAFPWQFSMRLGYRF